MCVCVCVCVCGGGGGVTYEKDIPILFIMQLTSIGKADPNSCVVCPIKNFTCGTLAKTEFNPHVRTPPNWSDRHPRAIREYWGTVPKTYIHCTKNPLSIIRPGNSSSSAPTDRIPKEVDLINALVASCNAAAIIGDRATRKKSAALVKFSASSESPKPRVI